MATRLQIALPSPSSLGSNIAAAPTAALARTVTSPRNGAAGTAPSSDEDDASAESRPSRDQDMEPRKEGTAVPTPANPPDASSEAAVPGQGAVAPSPAEQQRFDEATEAAAAAMEGEAADAEADAETPMAPTRSARPPCVRPGA